MARAADVRLSALLDALESAPATLVMVLALGRTDQFAKLIVEPLIAKITLLFRDPFLKPEMRFDDELGHGVLRCRLQLAIVEARLSPYDDQRHAVRGMMDMNLQAYPELSLRELRALHVLFQERSITRTAQAMETTQP